MESKRILTKEELKMIEGMAMVRLPLPMMATIMGIAEDTLQRMYKNDAAVREVIDGGQAKSSQTVRKTLFQMAVGYKDDKGKRHDPDFQALKWWTQSQEGFKSAERLELTGADGAPLKGISDEEVDAKLEAALKRERETRGD